MDYYTWVTTVDYYTWITTMDYYTFCAQGDALPRKAGDCRASAEGRSCRGRPGTCRAAGDMPVTCRAAGDMPA